MNKKRHIFPDYNPAGKKNNKLPLILAFVLPVLMMLVLYIGRDIFPFGNNMYLRSDMYHQYAPFVKEFQRNIQQGGSLLYSWNIGLGTNFVSTYAYYLASPANWFVMLFPDTLVPEFMNLMLILKAGLMSSLFAYYVVRKFRKNDLSASVFGCFYAMSSYMVAFSWNVMWLDCLVVFPLILMGLEALVKEGRIRMYTISLAICVISNYYISIMICIYLVFYFVYLLVCENKGSGCIDNVRKSCKFVLYSIIGGCMAMFVVLPAFYNLFFTASSSSSFPHKMTAYYNLLEMISKAVINVEPAVFSGHFPNIYSSMALFILVPLYWISRKVKAREKAGKTVLLCLLAFSFMFNIPTYIWHGFHFPNSLPCRYSFIFIFVGLVMGYEAVIKIRTFRVKEIVLCAAVSAAGIFVLQFMYSETISLETGFVAAAFILLYLICLLMVRHKRINRIVSLVLLTMVAITEMMINSNETGYSTTSRTAYTSDNECIERMLEEVDDGSFYRVEKVTRRSKNDGTWSDYRSASIFSSTTIEGNSDFYSKLGMQGRTNAYSYYGHTPVTQALLGVKYEISSNEIEDRLMTLAVQDEDMYLYENKYAMPLAFTVNKSIVEAENTGYGPFGYQNDIISKMTGVEGLFEYFGVEQSSELVITAANSGRMLAYITSDVDECNVEIAEDGEIVSSERFDSVETPQVLDLGDVQEGQVVSISAPDPDGGEALINATIAIMDYDKYDEAMTILTGNGMQIETFDDTYIKGKVTLGEEQLIFTTVPYDEGWTLYVDGVKTEYSSFERSFIIMELDAGEHVIELKYWPLGLSAGAVISLIALAAFVITEIVKKIRKKHAE